MSLRSSKSIHHLNVSIFTVTLNSVTYVSNCISKMYFFPPLLLYQDYERSIQQLSLDDIERLAVRLLHPNGESMDSSYMD